MPTYNQQLNRLRRIVVLAEKVLKELPEAQRQQQGKRTRRTGKDLRDFRKMLKLERRKGTSVAKLAKKHGVSTAYIYALR
jgi:hypothetical protein